MKIRVGFISNSSSSSFVVIVKDNFLRDKEEKRLITEQEEKILLDKGYQYISFPYPSKLEVIRRWMQNESESWPPKFPSVKPDEKCGIYLGFGVDCNQNEEIEWLTKRGIPFQASCHYGHETIIFDGKILTTIQNPGIRTETYGLKNMLDDESFNDEEMIYHEEIE